MIAARQQLRTGPAGITSATGVPARTLARILTRHRMPPLSALDPVTGQIIRATRLGAQRYEHPDPGSLIHVDVKNPAASPTAAAGKPTAATTSPAATNTNAPRSATTTSTLPPTPRCSATPPPRSLGLCRQKPAIRPA
ncbi:hypothetical protein [Cryptosporangium phraense]|uniref:Uncharacterized protein n=1 Tax=Cryptosporangium phraense TaxID=2593070 RepID=A0A545ATQ4_9ACTN|nr:hypothetical protein FL583_12075 [Cryptosporangium phraense]